MAEGKPAGFPGDIPLHLREYRNWSQTIEVADLWTCEPRSADDVLRICNWAKDQSPPWAVRPRGIRHGWSPLTITADTVPQARLIIVDTTVHLNALAFTPATASTPPTVEAEVGATMEDLLTFLEAQSGGKGSAPGYAFPHVPAPGHLSVGGVLAINAHGTAVPVAGDSFPSSYGSLSNHILSFTAVVSDPDSTESAASFEYVLRTFERSDPEAAALLTHAGRAFLVSAKLQVINNYNLRCESSMTISADTLFQAPSAGTPPPDSLASFLESAGRVEAIWYPFTENPWLKVWTVAPSQPSGSVEVTQPYNYPFSDNLPTWVTSALKIITTVFPAATPDFQKGFAAFTWFSLQQGLTDLWGASKNTLLYIKDTTLRVGANGYAIQMRRADVQQAVFDFAQTFNALLESYAAKGQYPVNSPLEIRVTGLDDPAQIWAPGGNARTPLISSLCYDDVAKANGWDCAVWFDVLTLPGTPHSDAFYTDFENWFCQRFKEPEARLLPEWSKGWAYTESGGAWTNPAFLARIREEFTAGRDETSDWNYVVSTLAKFDRGNIFSNRFLDTLFVAE